MNPIAPVACKVEIPLLNTLYDTLIDWVRLGKAMYNLYLYKIESQNLERGVCIVGQCEALHVICWQIQHDMESNMGKITPLTKSL